MSVIDFCVKLKYFLYCKNKNDGKSLTERLNKIDGQIEECKIKIYKRKKKINIYIRIII